MKTRFKVASFFGNVSYLDHLKSEDAQCDLPFVRLYLDEHTAPQSSMPPGEFSAMSVCRLDPDKPVHYAWFC
jgi:hypothetical protein